MAYTAPLSKFQMYSTRSWAGLSEENNLRNAFMTEPTKMKSIVAYALSSTYYNRTTAGTSVMSLLTDGLGATETIESDEYRWDLFGQNERAIEVLGNKGDGGSTPGYGRTTFRVTFVEKYFAVTDTLSADDYTQVRVQSEPYQGDGGWIYELGLVEPDPTKYIDPLMISAGARFSKLFSAVEELSMKGGDMNFVAPFKMKNRLTRLRKNHTVSRDVATDLMIMEMPAIDNPNGPKTKYWFTKVEWDFMAQWAKEKDQAMIRGIHSGDQPLAGENGRPVTQGAGLRQQISPANIRYYNKLTYKLLDDLLADLSYTAVPNGGNHRFLAFTGKQGLRAFSNAINDHFKGIGASILVNGQGLFIDGQGNNLTFTGDQWVTANFPNGVVLTVREMPMYDDPITNRQLDPVTGKPTESFRFTIFNIGANVKGGANIKKVVKKDSEDIMTITPGMYNPYKVPNGGKSGFAVEAGSGLDGFTIYALTHEGIMLADPTSAAELLYSIN